MKRKTTVTNPHFAQLLELMKENPHLQIVPMVDAEVVADDTYCFWYGSWGPARLDKYYKGEECIYFYDENNMEGLLVETKGLDWYESASDEETIEAYRSFPWVKCITVFITTPEE